MLAIDVSVDKLQIFPGLLTQPSPYPTFIHPHASLQVEQHLSVEKRMDLIISKIPLNFEIRNRYFSLVKAYRALDTKHPSVKMFALFRLAIYLSSLP